MRAKLVGLFLVSSGVMHHGVFVLHLTAEEQAHGFTLVETDAGLKVAALRMADDLLAVKKEIADGTIEYVIYDRNLEPIVIAGRTLTELERFH